MLIQGHKNIPLSGQSVVQSKLLRPFSRPPFPWSPPCASSGVYTWHQSLAQTGNDRYNETRLALCPGTNVLQLFSNYNQDRVWNCNTRMRPQSRLKLRWIVGITGCWHAKRLNGLLARSAEATGAVYMLRTSPLYCTPPVKAPWSNGPWVNWVRCEGVTDPVLSDAAAVRDDPVVFSHWMEDRKRCILR